MTKPGKPELRPGFPGERVHLADLEVGDVIDRWSKRSGSWVLRENLKVIDIRDDGVVLNSGHVLPQDGNWGEIRLKERA